jgi:hypothetical protein
VRRRGRCCLQGQTHRLGNFVIADLARRAAAGLVTQPANPLLGKASAPFADGVLVGPDDLGNDLVLHPVCCRQHNPRPSRQPLCGASPARQTFQLGALG